MSGAIGRRYFFISDLRRDDIASFDFRKVTAFAIEYLLATIIAVYVGFIMIINGFGIIGLLFLVASGFLFFFIYQTYVGFSLKTKSGDTWVMRHQLANPATKMRQFIGSEQGLFSRMLTNRLEEKEIINAVQVLRSSQLGLQPKRFETEVEKNLKQLEEDGEEIIEEEEFTLSKFVSKRFSKKRMLNRRRIQLSLEDILLKDEEVVWEKIIPFPLNWKFATMLSATTMFILTLPAIFYVGLSINLDTQNYTVSFSNINPVVTFICFITSVIMYFVFQLKYFSLRRKSMVITKNRVFYEELVRPPKWLFFLGIFKESYIRESMVNQLQIVGSGAYIAGGYHWERFIENLKQLIIRSILYFLTLNLSLLILTYWRNVPAASEFYILTQICLFGLGIMIVWSSSNMIVHLIQSWPTLEISAEGIGVSFRLPYLSEGEAERAQFILFSGVGTIENAEKSKRILQTTKQRGGRKV